MLSQGEQKPCAREGISISHKEAEGGWSVEKGRREAHRSRDGAASGLGSSQYPVALCEVALYFRELSNLSEAENWQPINQTWPAERLHRAHTSFKMF